jgi:hypothetical protein
MGFTTYITPEPAPAPTLAERLAALSSEQKVAILDGYEIDKKPFVLKHEMGIPTDLIRAIYQEITNVRVTTKLIIRGEVLIEEGTYDEEGNEITPPVYNDPPTTIADLKAEVALSFPDVFSAGQIGAIIDRMIAWAEVDAAGNPIGTAGVWAEEVVK